MTIAPQGTMRILELITAQNGEITSPSEEINNKKLIGMNKTIYIAPEVEQIKVRFEENIMSAAKTNAPKMDTESADAWGEWE